MISSGNVWLTGENGDVEFAMDDGNMAITDVSGFVAGPGGFVVSGAAGRTFTAKGTYLNEGTIRVTGGAKVDFNVATINGPTNLVVEAGSVADLFVADPTKSNWCVVEKDFESIDRPALPSF